MSSTEVRRESDIPVYEMVCDLCLAPNSVRWCYFTDNNCTKEEWYAHSNDPDYRAADGQPLFHQNDSRWAVCQVCHELIQANNRKVLFGRMMDGHRHRKRTNLAERLQARRFENDEERQEIEGLIKRLDAMHEVAMSSPAMSLTFDMTLARDIEACLLGFMRYKHPEVVAEPYTRVDRVLATRWDWYTGRGAMPVFNGTTENGEVIPDDAICEISITETRGMIPVLSDGEHRG